MTFTYCSSTSSSTVTLLLSDRGPVYYGDNHGFPWPSSRDHHWVFVLKIVNTLDHQTHMRNKEVLDRQYHCALFASGLVGTILMDSYKWFSKPAGLSFIARLCSTTPLGAARFIPWAPAMIINALWFLTFIIVIISVHMSNLCLQWLQEFREWPLLSSKNLLAFRQIHYESLRRWRLFEICNLISVLLPLAVVLWFSGVLLLLWKLSRVNAYILIVACVILVLYYLTTALHPLFFSLFARRNTLSWEISPFRSSTSWLSFKFGYRCILALTPEWRGKLPRIHHPADRWLPPSCNPESALTTGQRATKSISWLEHDCSRLMDPENTTFVDAAAARALAWVDANSTIEKTPELLSSMYHCIEDLPLPTVLMYFRPDSGAQADGLAAAFSIAASVAAVDSMDREKARTLVLRLWLNAYGHRIPDLRTHFVELHLRCMDYFGTGALSTHLRFNSFEIVQPEDLDHLPLTEHILSTARSGLENDTFFEGTFKVVRCVMARYKGQTKDGELVHRLVGSVYAECKKFVDRHQSHEGDKGQAQLFIEGLKWFMSASGADSARLCSFFDDFIALYHMFPPDYAVTFHSSKYSTVDVAWTCNVV